MRELSRNHTRKRIRLFTGIRVASTDFALYIHARAFIPPQLPEIGFLPKKRPTHINPTSVETTKNVSNNVVMINLIPV